MLAVVPAPDAKLRNATVRTTGRVLEHGAWPGSTPQIPVVATHFDADR